MQNFELEKLEDRFEMAVITLPSGETIDTGELSAAELEALKNNAEIQGCESTCRKD